MNFRSLLALGVLISACGLAHAEDYPGLLHKLTKPGVLRGSRPGDFDCGRRAVQFLHRPQQPRRQTPEVEVWGTGLSAKTYVVRTLPTPRKPGAPGEIQAYGPGRGTGKCRAHRDADQRPGQVRQTLGLQGRWWLRTHRAEAKSKSRKSTPPSGMTGAGLFRRQDHGDGRLG